MTAINVVDFWPFDLVDTTKRRTFKYADKTGVVAPFSSTFYFDASLGALICSDSDENGVWHDNWLLQYSPVLGVIEVADWYPQTNSWLAALFGPVQKEVLSNPICWGGAVAVPSTISNSPKYNPLASTPIYCASGSGFQAISFETLLPSMTLNNGTTYENVLQFVYAQSWGGKAPTGARYWMAKGVGPIAIQWLGFNSLGAIIVTEPRCDATVANT